MEVALKVKELVAELLKQDQDLEVGMLTATDEYWGDIYGRVTGLEITYEGLDGPKSGRVEKCIVLKDL